LYCPKCGTQLPDDAAFCLKCGTDIAAAKQKMATTSTAPVLAPLEAKSLKCPTCGAPISPKFGEMIITCEYCGYGITLGTEGWKGIQKQTMLPLKFGEKDQVAAKIHDLLDSGLLHRHLQESSTLDEINLSLVPYWITSVSARTSIIASDVAVQAGELATTIALLGMMGGAMGGRRYGRGFAAPVLGGRCSER